MLTIGAELLLRIVSESDFKALSKLNKKLFVDNELQLYYYIVNFVSKYNSFPNTETFIADNNLTVENLPKEPIEYYLDKINRRFTKNLILENIGEINKALSKNKIDKVVNIFDNLVDEVKSMQIDMQDNFLNFKELLELSLNLSSEHRIKQLIGITTGWKTLDDTINGFTKGNFYPVVARVKMGKSAILIYMSRKAYHTGNKVLFFSLEMPAIEIADRLLGMEFKVNKNSITKGRLSSFTEYNLREEIDTLINPENYKLVDGKFSTSIKEVEYIVKQYRPDIVYIDGAYLLRANRRFNAKWELVTYTAEQLKYLAMDLQIPIVASYQFNRNISRKADEISDKGFENIGLSDAISQLASVGIALLKPSDSDTTRTIEIIGSRDGGAGKFTINWDWERMDFSEVDYE